MRKFVVKSLLFVLLLIAIDRSFIFFKEGEKNVFGVIADEKMQKLSSRIDSSKNVDVWVVGSSHAQFAFSPEVAAENTNVSSLNIAYGGGSNVGLQITLLKRLLIEKKVMPKVIVYAIDVFTLNAEPVFKDQSQEIFFNEKKNIFRDYDRYFYSCLKLYGRNIPAYLSRARHGDMTLPYFKKAAYNLSMFERYDRYEITENGWVKAYGLLNKNYIRYSDLFFNPDRKSIDQMNDYVELCRKNHIRLLFIQVPEHIVSLAFSKKYVDFNNWITTFTERNSIQYIDYDNIRKFPVDRDTLFFDSDHLNVKGAELFTKALSEDMKERKLL